MGVEAKLVNLSVVLVQACEFALTVQIIENHLAVGSSSRDVGAELAVRPLDIVNT